MTKSPFKEKFQHARNPQLQNSCLLNNYWVLKVWTAIIDCFLGSFSTAERKMCPFEKNRDTMQPSAGMQR